VRWLVVHHLHSSGGAEIRLLITVAIEFYWSGSFLTHGDELATRVNALLILLSFDVHRSVGTAVVALVNVALLTLRPVLILRVDPAVALHEKSLGFLAALLDYTACAYVPVGPKVVL